jgi:hypothetical protein
MSDVDDKDAPKTRQQKSKTCVDLMRWESLLGNALRLISFRETYSTADLMCGVDPVVRKNSRTVQAARSKRVYSWWSSDQRSKFTARDAWSWSEKQMPDLGIIAGQS